MAAVSDSELSDNPYVEEPPTDFEPVDAGGEI